jgi:cytochrome P450
VTTTHQANLGALFDPAHRPDPYPLFRQLREAGPFSVLDGAITVVATHDRCAAILRDPSFSSDRSRTLLPRRFGDDRADGERTPSFLSLDPPDHTRLRRLVAKAFTPKVIAALEPRIRQIVAELFAGFADADHDRFDLVAELAYPLPVRVISELLGVPAADHERFVAWSRLLVRGLDPAMAVTDPVELTAIENANDEFGVYFTDLIAERRTSPGTDLLSRLVLIEEQGDQLTEAELVSTCILLLVAGHETTANLIANGVLALLRHPDQLAALRAEQSLIAGTVDETLRYDPPVQLTTRVVRAPTPIGDVVVPTDGVLMLLLGAANRDPAVFAEPDRFDITRDARQHLSFAAGPHYCLGAPLARLEAGIALSAFADRISDPELDVDSLRYRPHVNLRGPERMVVGFSSVR